MPGGTTSVPEWAAALQSEPADLSVLLEQPQHLSHGFGRFQRMRSLKSIDTPDTMACTGTVPVSSIADCENATTPKPA